jgi:hypothetical protein
MATKTVATRLDPETVERLERVAQVDRRSVAQVMAMLIEQGLPGWEEELDARTRGFTPSAPATTETAGPQAAARLVRAAVRRAKSAP